MAILINFSFLVTLFNSYIIRFICRYPTFIDALRDLDDALSMCFLYAMFGKSKALPLEMIELSRRLTLEFMYYVMETKSLRKVFISIKGYYYEANIMGQNVRWVVPHHFVLTVCSLL